VKSIPFAFTGEVLPLVGQGTWMIEKTARDRAVEAIRTGVDLGMTVIDTAEMYGDGIVEEIVGEAIHDIRDRVFLVSKVLPSNATYDGIRRACDRSLKRLNTGYLDLYLLHWPGAHPIDETIRGLESLVASHHTRFIGVSNFDSKDLKGALQALRNEQLACNQVLYHLGDRGIERRVIPFCERRRIAVMGYSPFGHRDLPTFPASVNQIALRHNCTHRQLALAFLIRNGVFAIPKASSMEHLRENAAAANIALTPEDIVEIATAFPMPSRDAPLGMI